MMRSVGAGSQWTTGTHLWWQLAGFQRILALADGAAAAVETLHHVHLAELTLAHLQAVPVLAIVPNALKGLERQQGIEGSLR